jgi:hypothetical protein
VLVIYAEYGGGECTDLVRECSSEIQKHLRGPAENHNSYVQMQQHEKP